MFVYALVGMEIFAYKAAFNAAGALDMVNGVSPSSNFDTFYYAFITVFTLLTGDGWTEVMFRYYIAVGAAPALIYFVSFILLG